MLEGAQNRCSDLVNRSGGVHGRHRTGLRMVPLPFRVGEPVERVRDPMVEVVIRGFDTVSRAPAVGTRQGSLHRQPQQQRKIGDEAPRRKSVGRRHVGVRKTTSSNLVRVSRKEKPVGDHDQPIRQRGPDVAVYQLGPRGHEEQCLGSGGKPGSRLEQQATDLISNRCSARLPDAKVGDPARSKRFAEASDLGGLSDPLDALEDYELAAPTAHPSVMIELVDPFRMPSVIHAFTCSIVLSKFSCAAMARW